jgi:hypothetical protein
MTPEEKLQARQEARPRNFMTIHGCEITVDERNWTVKKGSTPYYFSTIDRALMHIADQEERTITTDSIEKLSKSITQLHIQLLRDFTEALHTAGVELQAKTTHISTKNKRQSRKT